MEFPVFHFWTEEFESVGRREVVLEKYIDGENSQSALNQMWQFCSGYRSKKGASIFFLQKGGNVVRLLRTNLTALLGMFCRLFSKDEGRRDRVELQ